MRLELGSMVASAAAARHRRLIALAGGRDAGWAALLAALESLGESALPPGRIAVSREEPDLPQGWERLHPRDVHRLLGQGPGLVVVDLHGSTEVRALCAAAGAVRGGGLLVLLCPDLDHWPDAPDALRDRLAPPPFTPDQVGRIMVQRLIDRLRQSAGVAVAQVPPDNGVELISCKPDPPAEAATPSSVQVPDDAVFSVELYDACVTADQASALHALEALTDRVGPVAVVLAADRGRGKSSALGLAAHGLQSAELTVALTGPGPGAVGEVIARVEELGGRPLHFVDPHEVPRADVLLVDEAAALSVPLLQRLSRAAPAVAFATTVHGYEGTGQGFAVRFREHLEARPGHLVEAAMAEPIRWAPGDPVETWSRHVFLLDADPGPAPDTSDVREVGSDELIHNETLLSHIFGLLVHAHYRTTPEDLVRLLDGPNIRVLAAMQRDEVAGVMLLAEEGGLDMETCAGLYEGRFRVRGNMLPETLTCHLAEEEAGELLAWRVLRLAVHPDLRRQGVGSRLVEEALTRAASSGVDYMGAGFAATPDLLRFWSRVGFAVARVAVTRSRISGEHSAVVVCPVSGWGEALATRLDEAFVRRFPHVLADALRGLDPAVARAAMRAGPRRDLRPTLTADDWRVLLTCAHGALLYDGTVQPVWELVRCYLSDRRPPVQLDDSSEDLLLTKVLQHRPWPEVVTELGLADNHEAMRRLRAALRPLVMAYGPAWVRTEVSRFGKGSE